MTDRHATDNTLVTTQIGKICAIVLCFNSVRHIDRCLTELNKALDDLGGEHEIIVIENGSQDGSVGIVQGWEARRPGRVLAIYSPENLGTTVSRNLGLKQAKGEFILVLDSDAFITGHVLAALRTRLQAYPRLGMVVPRLHYGDGRFQLSTDEFPTLLRKFERLVRLRALEQAHRPPEQPVEVEYAISACWMLPRHVVDIVGPLDEQIFYSPEDVDYCARIGLAGFDIVYDPTVIAVHDAQELSRSRKVNGFFSRHLSGLLYFFRKYGCYLSAAKLRQRIAAAKSALRGA
jgi:GT2 family glycosyltransferase